MMRCFLTLRVTTGSFFCFINTTILVLWGASISPVLVTYCVTTLAVSFIAYSKPFFVFSVFAIARLSAYPWRVLSSETVSFKTKSYTMFYEKSFKTNPSLLRLLYTLSVISVLLPVLLFFEERRIPFDLVVERHSFSLQLTDNGTIWCSVKRILHRTSLMAKAKLRIWQVFSYF